MEDNNELIEIPTLRGSIYISKFELPLQIYVQVSGLNALSLDSLNFFCNREKSFGKNWHPLYSDGMYRKLELDVYKVTEEPAIQEIGEAVIHRARELKTVNVELMNWVSLFWNYKSHDENENFAKSGRKRFRIRNGEALPWEENQEFQQKLIPLKRLVLSIEALEVQLLDELFKVYGYSRISNMGSQHAKDLIDKSYASPNKQAIKYLQKAASLDEKSFMAYKAFNSLGDVYLAEGDNDLASENYTQSIQAIESVTRNPQSWTKKLFLLRGLSLAKLGKIQEGLEDIRFGLQGIEEPEKYFEIYKSEYQEALGLLSKYS